MSEKKFHYRAFTSLILTWCFLVLLVSGIVLFVSPPGRIANWTDWSIGGLTKDKWIAIHNLGALTFLVAGFFHLLKFNWKLFLHYWGKVKPRVPKSSWEVITSLLVMGIIIGGTLLQWQPFRGIIMLGETAKNSWEDMQKAPPVPHMEILSIQQVAERMDVPVEKVLETLQQAGLQVESPGQLLKDLAASSGKSPAEIYRLLQPQSPTSGTTPEKVAGHPVGSGLGQKTVADAAKELLLTPEEALAALKAKGIEATADQKIKDLADRTGMRPFDIIEIIRNSKK